MVRFLLATTSLEPRLSTGDCHGLTTTISTPHGDSPNPVLFTIYQEAVLRHLRSRLPTLDVEYADDSVVKAITDVSTSAATVICVVCRARVDIQHGNMGPDEIRARTSGRAPPSSSTPDRRHPLATPHIE